MPSFELAVPSADLPVDRSQSTDLAGDVGEGAPNCHICFDRMKGPQTSDQVFVACMGSEEDMDLAA